MNPDNRLLGLWVAVATLLGLFVGAAAGVIRWTDHHDVASALLTGGAACGGTITLALVVINMLYRRSP